MAFKSVDEILWCYHSNETTLVDLLRGAIYFLGFYKKKFQILWIFVFLVNEPLILTEGKFEDNNNNTSRHELKESRNNFTIVLLVSVSTGKKCWPETKVDTWTQGVNCGQLNSASPQRGKAVGVAIFSFFLAMNFILLKINVLFC